MGNRQIMSYKYVQLLFNALTDFQVAKTGLAGLKIQTYLVQWAIPVFRYDDIRDILLFGILIIHVVSINKHDNIGVLLYAIVNNDITCHKIM